MPVVLCNMMGGVQQHYSEQSNGVARQSRLDIPCEGRTIELLTISMNRREFLATSAMAGVGLSMMAADVPTLSKSNSRPAILGGNPIRTTPWQRWPVFGDIEDKTMLDAVRSGHWYRYGGKHVAGFEKEYAQRAGAKYCIATNSGTTALFAALGALGIGPGDEVILPPYTFVATYNVITLNYALPVFVDVDLETSQIDANKIEAAITSNTRAIVPVHIGGNPADLDKILAIGKKHNIPVIEDACQSHLAEWRGKMVGTWGLAGCFSFQASKNLNSGEGGAILTNDAQFANFCEGFQDQGRPKKGGGDFARGGNFRMTEFQGAMLQAQMTRIEEFAKRREENGKYLDTLLRQIPGILLQRSYDGCTRHAYHLYAFRYQPEQFTGLTLARFMQALNKEGIECGGGYTPMSDDAHIRNLLKNPHYQRLYSKETLQRWEHNLECPQNRLLCSQNVRLSQYQLLGPRGDMEQIAEAIHKIQVNAADIAKMG
jgi:perosamine synthetase